jgi:hypothetical protein
MGQDRTVNRATTMRVGLLALIWGSGFLWIKLGIRGLSPVEITLARLVLGSAGIAFILAGVALTRSGSESSRINRGSAQQASRGERAPRT